MATDFTTVGYCTNVHAGADLQTMRANLQKYALAVKERVSPHGPMGIGLWLSATAAETLLRDRGVGALRDWLRDVGLVPYTMNGFPHGDFHDEIVKHRVYRPNWWEPARMEYTLDLVYIQHELLPEGLAGSISTLPVAWNVPLPNHGQKERAAEALLRVADRLARLERETGRYICLCLEPEPGCHLQSAPDVVRFFHNYLWIQGDQKKVRRYLKVCHDICHSAVMFEPQAQAFKTYATAAIGVGKVQVSAAVATPNLGHCSDDGRRLVFQQLGGFQEKRYLHQTVILDEPKGEPEYYEDLPLALEARQDPDCESGEWRVHFHVPIYLDHIGRLRATQKEIRDGLAAARAHSDCAHFEVETYAWGVLPEELREPDLAAGIARELAWYVRERDALATGGEAT